MPEHKNLLHRVVYDEPYTKTCYQDVFGAKIPYPCGGMQRKQIEIFLVTKYPDEATPVQKAAILNCAKVASGVALGAFKSAYATTTAATAGVGGIVAGVAAGITAAEVAGRTSFDECKRKSLPNNIARKTGIAIRQEKSNRTLMINYENPHGQAYQPHSYYSPNPYQNHYAYSPQLPTYPYEETPRIYDTFDPNLVYNHPYSIEAIEPVLEEESEVQTFSYQEDNIISMDQQGNY